MVWVPKAMSASGGSATDNPIVATTFIKVGFPRINRNNRA